MSGDAIKAYVYLLCASWLQEPRATLPKDRVSLAMLSRLSIEKWDTVSGEVLQHYKDGKCDEHLGRLYNDTLLEVSRKWENNQRPKNKNAKRSRIKHQVNAALDNDNAIDNDTENAVGKDSKYWLIGMPWVVSGEISTRTKPEVYIETVKAWLKAAPEEYWTELNEKYELVDAVEEAKKALEWLIDRPKQRRSSVNLFLKGWLRRSE